MRTSRFFFSSLTLWVLLSVARSQVSTCDPPNGDTLAECQDVCYPSVSQPCTRDVECGNSNNLFLDREDSIPETGICVDGFCQCAENYGCGGCNILRSIEAGLGCNNEFTTARPYIRGQNLLQLFDVCDDSFKAGFTPGVCRQGAYDPDLQIYEGDKECSGHGVCVPVNGNDVCACNSGYMCADCSLTTINDVQFGASCYDYVVGGGYCLGSTDCSGHGRCIANQCSCDGGFKCAQCDGPVDDLIFNPPQYRCACSLAETSPDGGSICLGDQIEVGKPRYRSTEEVDALVTANFEDGSSVDLPRITVPAGQRVEVSTLLNGVDVSQVETFSLEVRGSGPDCADANTRSRFINFEVYDEGLLELGSLDILSIDVSVSEFSANIARSRAPRRVLFSPRFNGAREPKSYTIKLSPSEQAIFVSPGVLCDRSQAVRLDGGQPSSTALRAFGDYYYEVPGDALIFQIEVYQKNNATNDPVLYTITIDKSPEDSSFITSSEGLALIGVVIVVVFGAAGSVYYVNKNANRKLKMIEEDFDNDFDALDAQDASSVGVVAASACPPCVHCGLALATPRDRFCRNCATEQPTSSPLNQALSPRLGAGSNAYCRNCGKTHKKPNDKFCFHCGTPVRTHNSKEI